MESPCELCLDGTFAGPVIRDFLVCDACGFCRKSSIPGKKEILHNLRNFLLGACSTGEREKRRLDNAHLQLDELEAHTTPGTLYDVGANAGFIMKAALIRGWRVSGNEVSIKAVRWAKERYGIDIFHGFLEDDETGEGRLDAVVLWNTLEHLRDPVASMGRVHSMLRPGGLVHIRVPIKDAEEVLKFYEKEHMTEFTEGTMDLLRCRVGLERVFARESRRASASAPGTMDFLWRKPE